MEIRIIIDGGPPRSKRYLATPEERERNRREAAAQREIDERAHEKALRDLNTNATEDSSTNLSR